jgi:hypothetical protein
MDPAEISEKKRGTASQKYPGSDAAMKGAISDPIGKTPNCSSEQNCSRR